MTGSKVSSRARMYERTFLPIFFLSFAYSFFSSFFPIARTRSVRRHSLARSRSFQEDALQSTRRREKVEVVPLGNKGIRRRNSFSYTLDFFNEISNKLENRPEGE